MKKKGFTLIELLTVILILGIIALIAIPTVTNIIKESKRGAFKASVQNIIGAVETECQLEQMKGEELTTTYTFTNGSIDNDLNIKGDLPKSGTITVDSSCNVEVDVTDGTFTATKSAESDEIEIGEAGKEEEHDDSYYKELGIVCRKARTLHTEECDASEEGTSCVTSGYTTNGSKGTTTITYGQVGIKGTLKSGDAFDCDVNNDGVYDPTTERFYYVSDYYNTTTQAFDKEKAVLIYYNNTTSGIADNTETSDVAYYPAPYENWHGPETAVPNLPTKEQWTNSKLITGTRAIVNEKGGNLVAEYVNGNYSTGETISLPTAFDYTNYAARLLTTQELEKACGITVGEYNEGELDSCNYLLENTVYSSWNIYSMGFWLENPYADNSDFAWAVDSISTVSEGHVFFASFGVRPVITVLKSDIAY